MKKEIIQWEEQFWVEFQKKLKMEEQRYKVEGMELHFGRRWVNWYAKPNIESTERIEFLPGYVYCCYFSIQKNGKEYAYRGEDEDRSIGIFRFVKIYNKLWFPSVWYRHGIYQKKHLYAEIDPEKMLDLQEMLDDYFDEIKKGLYVPIEGSCLFDDTKELN